MANIIDNAILIFQLSIIPLLLIAGMTWPLFKRAYENRTVYTARNFTDNVKAYDYARQAAAVMDIDPAIVNNIHYTKETYEVLIQGRLMGYNFDDLILHGKNHYGPSVLREMLSYYTLGYDEEIIKNKLGVSFKKLFDNLSADSLKEVRFAIMDGLTKEQILKMIQNDISGKKYVWNPQMKKEIRLGFKHGLTMDQVNIYANKPEPGVYGYNKMKPIRIGLEEGIDVMPYTWRPYGTHCDIIKEEEDIKYVIGTRLSEYNFMMQMCYALISKKYADKEVADKIDDMIAKINTDKNREPFMQHKYGIVREDLEVAYVTILRSGIEANLDMVNDWWEMSSFNITESLLDQKRYFDNTFNESLLTAFDLLYKTKLKEFVVQAKTPHLANVQNYKLRNRNQKFVVIEED